jgi:class 3 adenylate cyclase
MKDGADVGVQRLLERAVEAVDMGAWDVVARLAEQIVALDPENEYASALLTLTGLRSERKRGRAPGTRRRVTVMFCDMVGSTDFATGVDPEQLHDLVQDFLGSCTETIEQFDGHVVSLLGDGLLAYFGFPRAHEDDAVRAVLAGCRILSRVRTLPPLRVGDVSVRAAIRIGIHSGLAVATELGVADRVLTNDVVGETPTLASRIQAIAGPDSVVISSETADLVGNHFDVRPLPPTPLKGFRREVRLFHVEGVRAVPSRFDAVRRFQTGLVGRVREREVITAEWSRCCRPSRRTLALVGEPGMGKSRLLAYARAHATALGGAQRTLQCSPYHGSTPLYPVVSALEQESAAACPEQGALEQLVERLGISDPADVFVLARLLNVDPPSGVPPVQISAEVLRERALTLVLAWLEELATRAPLLLAVEDLQWADPTTLELLTRVVARTDPLPMLTVLTSRTPEAVSRVGQVQTLVIGPLDREHGTRFVEDMARDMPEAARRLIVQRSDGVPLYAEELTRMLRQAASERQASVNDIEVPPTLSDLLVARLDQYPAELGLAQVVATVGKPVGLALLSRLLPFTSDELRRQLEVLVEARLLRVVGDGPDWAYEFRHTLQREAAYQLQLLARRRVVHAAVAAALAAEEEEGTLTPDLLAYHCQRAEDFPAAARHWYRAAVRHSSVAAHAEVIHDCQEALAALDRAPSPESEQLELQVRSLLAQSLLATRGYTSPEVAAAYDRLRGLPVLGGRHELPSMFGVWAYYHTHGENQVSEELARRLVDAAVGSADAGNVLATMSVMGKQLLWAGRFRPAARMLRTAAAYQQLDDAGPFPHHAGVGAGVHLAMVLWIMGLPRRSRAVLEDAVAAAERLETPNAEFSRAYTHAWAASLCHVAGDLEAAEQHASRVVAIATERGFSTWKAVGRLLLTVVGALTQEPTDYIPTIRESLDAYRRAGSEAGRTQFLLGLAQACAIAGEPRDALEAVDEALAHAAVTEERQLESPLRRFRGELLLTLEPDRPLQAAAELRASAEVASRQGARAFELAAIESLRQVGAGGRFTDAAAASGRSRRAG